MKNIRVLFVEAHKQKKAIELAIAKLNIRELVQLPKDLVLAYSIQYREIAEKIKELLERNKFKIKDFIQVLGCSKINNRYKCENLLLISSGKFHSLNIVLNSKRVGIKNVYIYNIGVNRLEKPEALEISRLEKNLELCKKKFLTSDKIGILVSTKHGQNDLISAEKIKEKINKKFPEKRVYIFISNNINPAEFENFDTPIFINTACSGLAYDSGKIINSDDILEFL